MVIVAESIYSWPKHWLLLRNRYILGQNIDYFCEIDIFLSKTSIIIAKYIFLGKTLINVAKSTYSWPKHWLLLRNRHILGQNIDYCCEIGIFLAKTLIIGRSRPCMATPRTSWGYPGVDPGSPRGGGILIARRPSRECFGQEYADIATITNVLAKNISISQQ